MCRSKLPGNPTQAENLFFGSASHHGFLYGHERREVAKRRGNGEPNEPEYANDLRILRRFVQDGSFELKQSGDVVFRTLKTRYSEAHDAFGRECRREALGSYATSPYIELQRRTYPNSPDKDGYLGALKRLRHQMVPFKLGYRGRIMTVFLPFHKRT